MSYYGSILFIALCCDWMCYFSNIKCDSGKKFKVFLRSECIHCNLNFKSGLSWCCCEDDILFHFLHHRKIPDLMSLITIEFVQSDNLFKITIEKVWIKVYFHHRKCSIWDNIHPFPCPCLWKFKFLRAKLPTLDWQQSKIGHFRWCNKISRMLSADIFDGAILWVWMSFSKHHL